MSGHFIGSEVSHESTCTIYFLLNPNSKTSSISSNKTELVLENFELFGALKILFISRVYSKKLNLRFRVFLNVTQLLLGVLILAMFNKLGVFLIVKIFIGKL